MITAEDIIHCVEFVNSYRKEVGLEPLEDLPQGIPRNTRECILARAFNYNGRVDGQGGDWFFGVQLPIDKAEALVGWATNQELKCHEDPAYYGISGSSRYIKIYLPKEISVIAMAFDHWGYPGNDLIRKYVEAKS